jgi:hypothetical protein
VGKRSTFERRERDFYPTPAEAVVPLLRHLRPGTAFVEPCAGAGDLIDHLTAAGHVCVSGYDIEPRREGIERWNALNTVGLGGDAFITNPPWSRDVLHPLIVHLSNLGPTWLLFDADWAHTRQAAPFADRLRRIVSVGRVKWIPNSPFTGKDNCAWYLFGKPNTATAAAFYMREAA